MYKNRMLHIFFGDETNDRYGSAVRTTNGNSEVALPTHVQRTPDDVHLKRQLNFSLNGEQVVYEGVQNLGNLEGSLIDHIRNDENMQVYNRYYYDLNAVHDPTKADRIRNNGSFLLVPYLESHISLSNKETIIQEQLHNSDVLTIEANADYLHAMEDYIQESRYCLNVGYDLPAEPRKVDFDQNLADSKSKNLEVTSQESEKKKPHNSPSKSHKTKSIRL